MKTLLSIKTDPRVKEQAKELAHELGLSLSALITAQLKQAIRTKSITLSTPDFTPTPYLENILRKADKDIKAGKNLSPVISNAKELDDYFNSL
ncbi:MAG: Uncharacterized protein CEN91_121 [Candidatus Berkelbacteria bacterium Licking1014_85]|uniref:DNA-damage-inducible protein J n=1 Tax=Candidatus Berkelbacteria bacterium Licking1014_85 TaxID=2017148 RepID=A0A554LLN9_9BACT|nr:MAG: Uncharacterized protein CEN91_121 [Candidatus Berkelbacteria bacterium Licking1014_85]